MAHRDEGLALEDAVFLDAVEHLDDATLFRHYDELLYEYVFMLSPAEQELRRYRIQTMLVVIRRALDARHITWDRFDEVADAAARLNP